LFQFLLFFVLVPLLPLFDHKAAESPRNYIKNSNLYFLAGIYFGLWNIIACFLWSST
jgi:hypothetical protein